MNYSLAKQLKDAGFPQYGAGYFIGMSNRIIGNSAMILQDFPQACYIPTLEELIEACGEVNTAYLVEALGEKFTVEEFEKALVSLWLELNKK